MQASQDSYLKIAIASIQCFTDDGTLDIQELNFLLGIALADQHIDDEEKRVLQNIFSQVSQTEVSEKVWERMQAIEHKYGL